MCIFFVGHLVIPFPPRMCFLKILYTHVLVTLFILSIKLKAPWRSIAAQRPEFKPQFSCLLAMWAWVSYLLSLCFTFFISKVKIITVLLKDLRGLNDLMHIECLSVCHCNFYTVLSHVFLMTRITLSRYTADICRIND